MINKLHIKNVQGHKDSLLELGPGINTIIGRNDCGKTSIFRNVIWILENRPLGDGIIRKDQPDSAFTLMETDTCTVTREKGSKVNQYTLSGVKDPYTGFGTNPPEDIVEALNFDAVNIQSQSDPPFLVLSPPGQVAQHIRSISGLDVVDKVTALIKSKISNETDQKGRLEADRKEAESELADLEQIDIGEMESLIQKAESLQEENKEIGLLQSSLEKIVTELEEVEEGWIHLPEDVESILKRGTKAIAELDQSGECCSDLHNLLSELESLDGEIIEFDYPAETFISRIEQAEKQYNNAKKKIDQLEQIVSDLEKAESQEMEFRSQIDEDTETLLHLLDEITTCPYCTSELTKGTKEKLLENY